MFGNKKAPADADAFLVELVENSLHLIVEELERWQPIIGEHFLGCKLEEQRNSLTYKTEGYSTYLGSRCFEPTHVRAYDLISSLGCFFAKRIAGRFNENSELWCGFVLAG